MSALDVAATSAIVPRSSDATIAALGVETLVLLPTMSGEEVGGVVN